MSALSAIAKLGVPATGALYGMTHSPEAEAIFAGKLAKNFQPMVADKMQKLIKEGKTPEEAWNETKYFLGQDNQPRFEMDDQFATINNKRFEEFRSEFQPDDVYLEDIFDHPELYENYPNARYIKTGGLSPSQVMDGFQAYYSEEGNKIGLHLGKSTDEIRKTLMHELQHYVQGVEDFSRGGSPEAFSDAPFKKGIKKLKRYGKMQDQYKKIADDAFEKFRKAAATQDPNIIAAAKKHMDEADALVKSQQEKMDLLAAALPASTPHQQYLRLKGEHEARLVEARLADDAYGEYPFKTKPKDDVPVSQLLDKPEDSIAHISKHQNQTMADIARKAGNPFRNNASQYTSPTVGKLVDWAKGNKKLIGGPMELFYPEGAVNWLDTLARGQKPDWKQRVDVFMDLI